MILVTGGAGYIGSHCVLALLERGIEVVVIDNLSTGHLETIKSLKKVGTLHFIKCDLKNINDINNVFESYKIDAVFHFAGLSQVEQSMQNPEIYYQNNVAGTLNLLSVMNKFKVNKIIFSSTASVYGEPQYTPIDEKHPTNPINVYGKTKLIIENILEDYNTAYGIKSLRLRYFNVVGADKKTRIGEWHEPETHLIPNIIKSITDGDKPFKIYGNNYSTDDGTCVRDYINIDDLIQAHIKALCYLKNYEGTDFINLGTKNGTSILEIINTCEEETGKKLNYQIGKARDGDVSVLVSDNSKAKKVLNWKPTKTISSSIKSAFKWEIKKEK